MNNCKPSEERHRIAVGGRWSVSHIEWLRGDGAFIGFQGTLVLCIQSPEAMIPAASHHKRRVRPHWYPL